MIAPETTLEGTLVRLRPLANADIDILVRWYTDPDVLHWLHRSEDPAAKAESERGNNLASHLQPSASSRGETAWR